MTMLVFISDTHGSHRSLKIPNGDILVHCGDCMAHGRVEELLDLNDWFGSLPHKHKVLCCGNHDWAFQEHNKQAREILTNCIYLQDSRAEVMGIKFYGSPWQPAFFDWAFNLPRGEPLKEKWDLIYPDTDVLITHGPPAGILDVTREGRSTGCVDLLNKIKSIKPKIHAFGHIHEGYGTKKKYGVRFINASNMTRDYDLLNRPIKEKL